MHSSIRPLALGLLLLIALPCYADVRVQLPESEQNALAAEITVPLPLPNGTEFKIKLAGDVSSGTARKGDYVEFTVAEDVFSPQEVEVDGKKQTTYTKIVAKGTPVFGEVLKAKHRRFPFRNGTLEVIVTNVRAINGQNIPVVVRRPMEEEKSSIRGRKNASVGPVVPALAAAGAVYLKDTTARNVAVLTLVSNASVGDLLNGTDAKISNGEVFDAIVTWKPGDRQVVDIPIEPKKP